jgi:protein-S-isoprenylcysteine O-methyltransferase Ste14
MAVYRVALAALWLIFILVWVIAAFTAKKSIGGARSWRRGRDLGALLSRQQLGIADVAQSAAGTRDDRPVRLRASSDLFRNTARAARFGALRELRMAHSDGRAGIYFICSARAEERLMTQTFPNEYPAYRRPTKMLVPFVL